MEVGEFVVEELVLEENMEKVVVAVEVLEVGDNFPCSHTVLRRY